MDYVRQTVSSNKLSSIFNLPPTLRNTKVEVIILPVTKEGAYDDDAPKSKINLGFMPGPPLPDSFFDPMPEEDLQAWEGKYSTWDI